MPRSRSVAAPAKGLISRVNKRLSARVEQNACSHAVHRIAKAQFSAWIGTADAAAHANMAEAAIAALRATDGDGERWAKGDRFVDPIDDRSGKVVGLVVQFDDRGTLEPILSERLVGLRRPRESDRD